MQFMCKYFHTHTYSYLIGYNYLAGNQDLWPTNNFSVGSDEVSLLGKKFRVVIPSCVVTKIRKAFPNEDGDYEGFHETSDSDTDSE